MGQRYFSTATLDVLQDLEQFNERSWFHANKERFETEVREPTLSFIADLAEPLHKNVSKHLVADPRKVGGSMYRIHRDIRFSKDKTPYHTAVRVSLKLDARTETHGPSLYLHIEPGNSFVGAGLWMPSTETLTGCRRAMVDHPKKWIAARDAAALKSWERFGESLKRAPKGFDPDDPLIDDLRLKSIVLMRSFTERQVTGAKFLELFVERAAEAKPLMAWLCSTTGLKF